MPVDPLAELRDIHLPVAPGWWPPAPGWWVLAVLAIAALVVAALLLRVWMRRRRPRRAALRELTRMAKTLQGGGSLDYQAVSVLVRRAALASYPRREVAGLAGNAAWLGFLDRTGATQEFSRGLGRVLAEAPYAPAATAEHGAVIELVRRWVRRNL